MTDEDDRVRVEISVTSSPSTVVLPAYDVWMEEGEMPEHPTAEDALNALLLEARGSVATLVEDLDLPFTVEVQVTETVTDPATGRARKNVTRAERSS